MRVRRPGLPESPEQLDLDEIDRIYIGIPNRDRTPEHRVIFEELPASRDLEHSAYG